MMRNILAFLGCMLPGMIAAVLVEVVSIEPSHDDTTCVQGRVILDAKNDFICKRFLRWSIDDPAAVITQSHIKEEPIVTYIPSLKRSENVYKEAFFFELILSCRPSADAIIYCTSVVVTQAEQVVACIAQGKCAFIGKAEQHSRTGSAELLPLSRQESFDVQKAELVDGARMIMWCMQDREHIALVLFLFVLGLLMLLWMLQSIWLLTILLCYGITLWCLVVAQSYVITPLLLSISLLIACCVVWNHLVGKRFFMQAQTYENYILHVSTLFVACPLITGMLLLVPNL